MKQIRIQDARPGMVLAKNIFNMQGKILLSKDITLNEKYISKLIDMDVSSFFINDPLFEDIENPEYLSPQLQQQALTVLSKTMNQLRRGNVLSTDPVVDVASSLVEELVSLGDVAIHLTGIITYDNNTFAHCLNCGIYSAVLAQLCGLPVNKIKEVTCGAMLHDVGKLSIDLPLLNKPGKLTDEEMNIVKLHPEMGFSTLIKKRWELSSLVAHMAWQHHEHYDGTGYPRGLAGDEILDYSRILAIADVYEALTATRPYRAAIPAEKASAIIAAGLGSHFDPEYGSLFLSKIAIYSPGTTVLLNTGELAVVISVTASSPKRPLVRVISHPDGSSCISYKDINLLENPDLYILSTVSDL